jgi:hypothetical protein
MHFITSKLTAAQNGLRDIVRFIRDWLVVWNTAVRPKLASLVQLLLPIGLAVSPVSCHA